MIKGLEDFVDIFDDDEFEERPVDLTTFVQSPDFLGLPPLSDEQFKLVQKITTIYKPETIKKLYPEKESYRLTKGMVNEVIGMVGKGGGKNHSTVISVCYIVYQLLCLKDPAAYYGKPPGDAIDILNVAVNSTQANNTFFKPLSTRIKRCPWFDGRYDIRAHDIRFDKSVTCHSGHSEREAWEGYNFIMVVLDEIAAFKTEGESTGMGDRANTAPALYRMYKASVSSRFPDVGKLVLLSFTRFKGDYMTQRFKEAVAETSEVHFTHEFILHEDLPADAPNNRFDINWVEHRVVSYKEPRVYAVHLPTWRFNPMRKVEDFKMEFYRDPVDSMSRFACNPPDAIDAFFRDRERVELAFADTRNPFNSDFTFKEWFKPKDDTNYYIHVDLAITSDRAAVSMAHVSDWVDVSYGTSGSSIEPIVTIDCVRWWTPKSDKNVEISEIKDFLLALRHRGFDIQTITTDRWGGSHALRNELARVGIDLDTLSVDKKIYNDLALMIAEQRLDGYNIPLLVDELLALRIMPNGKVDHPRSGSNDLADAVAGAAHLAIANEEDYGNQEIEVHFLSILEPQSKKEPVKIDKAPPGVKMPEDLSSFVDKMKLL